MSKNNAAVSDVITVKPSEALNLIRASIRVNMKNARMGKDRRPLMIWGAPGIGKSALVKQVAREMAMELVDIRLSQTEPTDLRGIPIPVKDDNGQTAVYWAVPACFPTNPNARVVIFLDEIPNAPQACQSAAYQLVLDGKLGEYTLPRDVVVIAAGNRRSDKGGTHEMALPLQNRFAHIEVKVDHEDWVNYAVNTTLDASVVGYLAAFPTDLFEYNPLQSSRGFATPRSWEALSDYLSETSTLHPHEFRALSAGTVGEAIAGKFIAYRLRTVDLPNPKDVLSGKVQKLSEGTDISLKYALVTNLGYCLRDERDHKDREIANGGDVKALTAAFDAQFDNFLAFGMANFNHDLMIMAARVILKQFQIKPNTKALKNFPAFTAKYKDLLIA